MNSICLGEQTVCTNIEGWLSLLAGSVLGTKSTHTHICTHFTNTFKLKPLCLVIFIQKLNLFNWFRPESKYYHTCIDYIYTFSGDMGKYWKYNSV
jgi:hypothetical protein